MLSLTLSRSLNLSLSIALSLSLSLSLSRARENPLDRIVNVLNVTNKKKAEEENVIALNSEIKLLSLKTLRCVWSFYRVLCALKLAILHMHNFYIVLIWND